jgi:hypothetical protein
MLNRKNFRKIKTYSGKLKTYSGKLKTCSGKLKHIPEN